MTKKDYFTYNEGKEIVKDDFRISASSFSKYFDKTSEWYRQFLLGETFFTGNTASHLGTAVHAGIEMYIKEGAVLWDEIKNYIISIEDPEVDKNHILTQYEPMINCALSFVEDNKPKLSEIFVYQPILPGIGVGGSIDAVRGDTIYDWKTTSAKTPPTKFSRPYWFQLMIYAWLLNKQGKHIRFLKLVYITENEVNRISEKTGKPLKDYPSQWSTVVHEVTQEDLDLIESCINLVAESVQMFKAKPELRHIIAQDMRLKSKPAPITFKKE